MNQSKFSFADLFTILATVGFGFFCFLSLNFLSFGETDPSIIGAVVIAFILGGLAFGAKFLKRVNRNFKTCIILEWIILILFAVAAILAFLPFSHYFTISNQKEEIQRNVMDNISQAENIFTDYENYADNRLNIYENKLKSVVRGKNVNPHEYATFGFVYNTDDNVQIENKMFTLKAQLYPTNYQEMKTTDSNWLSDAKVTISQWKPIGIITVSNNVEPNLTSWEEYLKQLSSFRATGEGPDVTDYSYDLNFNAVKDRFMTFGEPTIVSVLCALGFYLFMLLSYFITRRDPKYPGFKMIFRSREIKDNEL